LWCRLTVRATQAYNLSASGKITRSQASSPKASAKSVAESETFVSVLTSLNVQQYTIGNS
jgi:hypothetical protein